MTPWYEFHIGRKISDVGYWLFVAILVVGAFQFGWSQWQQRSADAHFYQADYDAAVAFACTGQVGEITGDRPKALNDFLSKSRMSLTCEEVFPLPPGASVGEPNFFHKQIIGSIYLFGWLWKLFGVSWALGGWVAGLFSAMTMLGMILLARLFVPRWATLAIAPAVFVFDDGLRQYIIHLRDYSKAAFFFGLLFLLAACFEASGKRRIALAALAALGISLALGFRQDTSPFVYMFGLVLLSGLLRVGQRLTSVAALTAFLVVLLAFPFLVYDPWKESGTNVFHFYILGQTSQFLEDLKVIPSFFLPGYLYIDTAAWALVGLHQQSMGFEIPDYGTAGYDTAGRAVLLLDIWQFPGDVAAKSLSAFVLALFGWKPAGMTAGLLLAVGSFCVLLYYRRVKALIVLLALCFFAAITFIQFDLRHVFLYGIAAKLLVVSAMVLVLMDLLRIVSRNRWFGTKALDLGGNHRQRFYYGALPVLILVLVVAFIAAGRLWQGHSAAAIMEALENAPSSRTITRESMLPGRAEGGKAIPLDMSEGLDLRYARLRFDGGVKCAGPPRIKLIYNSDESYYDWTEKMTLFPRETATIYMPLLQVETNQLEAIELDARSAACFVSLEEIKLPAGVYPAFYWARADGSINRSYYSTGFEKELSRVVSKAVEKYRDMTCLPQSEVLSPSLGTQEISHEVTLGDVIELRIGDAGDGHESDHVDLVDPRIVVDGAETSLLDLDIVRSNIPLFTLEYDMSINKNPLTLNGQVHGEGFGVHAPAMFRLAVPEDLRGKRASVEMLAGLDDETGQFGSATVTLCYSQ